MKFEALDELRKIAADLGRPMTHLATAFVRAHPAVTSAIIGPRTHEQLEDLLAGADLELGDDVLDRIDAIVPPGEDLNRKEADYTPPSLADKAQRRR